MSSYSSLAFFYDAFMQDIDYDGWCDFYAECFSRFSAVPVKNIVDVGCGTGNITLPLAARGFALTGLDISDEMLSLAAKKAERQGLSVRFIGSDMRAFSLGTTADAAISSFDCVNYLLAVNDIESAFYHIRKSLPAGALFIFDVSTPYKYKEILDGNSFVYENDDCFMTWENYLNEKSGICDFYLTFFIREGKLYRREDEVQRQRMYSLRTLRRIAQKAGFEIVGEYGDIDFSQITETSERAFFVCRAV